MTVQHLTMAALVAGILAIGACFLAWSTPARSLADLRAEAYRIEAEGAYEKTAGLAAETREAFDREGTEAPFHGWWVLALAAVGVILAALGAFLATLGGDQRRAAEQTLRTSGVAFALAGVLVLLDGSPKNFEHADRAVGWWLAMACAFAACFSATIGSARVSSASDAASAADPSPDEPI